ncbi:MAG: hypothetical protein WC623_22410 [Pedobacter sp.]|uniref:hypothetical protein n=1 Tax=Pedobacter sp. TaxID=1411316 RepID=UPI003562B696
MALSIQKRYDNKIYTLDIVKPTKHDAEKYAEKIRQTEYMGHQQLARVEKGSLGWGVYVGIGRNIRYDIG